MSDNVSMRIPHVLLVDGFLQNRDQAWVRNVTNQLLETLRRVESEPLLMEPQPTENVTKYFESQGTRGFYGFPVTVLNEKHFRKIENSDYQLFPNQSKNLDENGLTEFWESQRDSARCSVDSYCRRLARVAGKDVPGLLLVLVPRGNENANRLWELLSEMRRGPVIDELEFLDELKPLDNDSEESTLDSTPSLETCTLERGLAIAQLVRRRGGTSLVVCETENQGGRIATSQNESPANPSTEFVHDDVRYFTFHLADYSEVDEKLIGTLTLRRKASFFQAERRGARDRIINPRKWGQWGLDPEAEVRRLIELEFSHYESFGIFDRICRAASGESLEVGERTRYHRILLTAVRLCKELANKTLEGTPFNFTLFIPAADVRDDWIKACCLANDFQKERSHPTRKLEDLNPVATLLRHHDGKRSLQNATSAEASQSKESQRTTSMCNPRHWVWFNFDFQNEASNHAELSQSPALAMMLDPETALLTHLLQKESAFTLDPLRFAQFENFFERPNEQADSFDNRFGVFIQGIGGRVEIHARTRDRVSDNKFCLEFNGFQWLAPPLKQLRKSLEEYSEDKEVVSNTDGRKQARKHSLSRNLRERLDEYFKRIPLHRRLEQAIATLLLHQKSSLILLCDRKDVERLDENNDDKLDDRPSVVLQPMRSTVQITRPVEWINPVPLAGLLQVDGLHVIAPRSSKSQADPSSERQKDKHYIVRFANRVLPHQSDDSSVSVSGAVGTGTSTAYYLAERFPHSRVIKVSASGPLKIIGPHKTGL